MKIALTQITDQKNWAGLTKANNLVHAGLTKGPAQLSQMISNLYEMVNGDDNLVSFIEKFPTKYVDQETYEWMLRGSSERNIPLVKAAYGTSFTEITSSTTVQVGLNFAPFYLYFAEKWFSAPSVIAGLRPEDYQVKILEDPTPEGDLWRYKVGIFGNNPNTFMPLEELLQGVPYGQMYAPVEREFSKRGSDIQYESFYKLQNTVSYFRKGTKVPGSMIKMGKNIPLAYAFQDDKGNKQVAWIDKVGYEFYKQFRRDYARGIVYGKNTMGADGNAMQFGESGNPIMNGYGLYEQMQGGNNGFYNVFNIDAFTYFLQGISYNKLNEDSRDFLVTTGEYGALQFHQAVQAKMGQYAWLRSDMNFKNISDMNVSIQEGQIRSFDWINGIKVRIMIDKMLDSPISAGKMRHPNGGYISSYIYNIWDFGTNGGEPNIRKVAVKGDEEYYKYVPGFRDPFTPGAMGTSMTMTTNMEDAYEIGGMKIGSVVIENPLRTARYMPSVYKYLGY